MPEILDGMSFDAERSNIEKLRAAFPDCFAEGKLDVDKLLSLCGEYVDEDFEKYSFTWKGKAECLRLAQKRSTGTLRPCPAESVNWDATQNLYIEGDNLEVLKLLMTAYFRKVKMIYIDPPYNTGNDFVYADDYADPLERYKEVTAQTTKSNPETMGRFHTNWLNMMYPRLRLAANLLRDDGVCFISIDDNEVTNLRKLCDEAFGEENFVFQIAWRRTDNQPNIGLIAKVKEYIVCYAKQYTSLTLGKLPLTEKARSEYRYSDEKGYFRRAILLDKTRGRHSYPVQTKSGHILNGSWMIKEENFKKLDEAGGVYWTQGREELPYGKIYLSDSTGQIPSDFWGIEFGTNQRGSIEVEKLFGKRVFDFPKPVSLVSTLVNLGAPSENDIILDFFSGSATTAHAVMQLNAEDGGNRQFIIVQLPEVCDEKSEAYKAGFRNICEIGKERIRRAGAKILDEAERRNSQLKIGEAETPPPDVGFRVFKLDASNLKTWDSAPIEGDRDEQLAILHARMREMIHRIKPDRSGLDMVFEVMLKMGVPLSVPVTEIDINGKTAYSVGEDTLLLVSLAPSLTAEDIEVMADYAPAKVIISQESFDTNSDTANAYYILHDRGIDLKLL